MRSLVLCAAVVLVPQASGAATPVDFVTDGDFEAGNTGFTSDLTFRGTSNRGADEYTVGSGPKAWNDFLAGSGDHALGMDDTIILKGPVTAGGVVWSQTVAVMLNVTHYFSGWIRDAFSGGSPITPEINGIFQDSTVPQLGSWNEFGTARNSGTATEAKIELIRAAPSAGFIGDDYAVDDLSFTGPAAAIPVTASIPLLAAALGAVRFFRSIFRGRTGRTA
jgi:hypothetical protein